MSEKQAPCQSNQEDSEKLRNRAIDRFLQGKRPAEIARELGHSRKWFYETLARYQKEGRAGLRERSRRPHHQPRQTAPEIEAAVVRVRKLIVSGTTRSCAMAITAPRLLPPNCNEQALNRPARPRFTAFCIGMGWSSQGRSDVVSRGCPRIIPGPRPHPKRRSMSWIS